ncbi:uncharacterized protein K452DRAFT_117195 [Aplosporella prunicola CBS 121167]|uniref:Rhodopsin domain-containing protein n=1 Tax=Aplosporella prunicola CBS 121167 TaxID=1176127 RepID=A0A6A6B1B5_9PEZI|nr:uncharacterized protein K452DRAFT_117195 [Aplosporella prunicola CBS 121167]KAF2136817.1 hypothetical protein K452DRAFT_117195 [Aplosporella prunicola CBS 121167]
MTYSAEYLQPAASPPPGVTQNFVNSESLAGEVRVYTLFSCCLATFFLILRLFARCHVLRLFGWDDFLVLIGQICAWIFGILSMVNIKNGYGIHIWNLSVYKVIAFKKYDLAEENVYCLGVMFIKLSVLVFYLRLNPDETFRKATFCLMGLVVAYNVLSMIVFTCVCVPVRAQWDVLMTNAKCINQLAFVYANASLNVVTDFFGLFLPIRMVWDLQFRSTKHKILLLIALTAGSFVCILSIVRIITTLPYNNSNDVTWYKVTTAKWCMVEINALTITACIPTLKPLLNAAFPTVFGSTKDSSSGPSEGQGSIPINNRWSTKKGQRLRGYDDEERAMRKYLPDWVKDTNT